MDSTLVNTGMGLLESLANPILAILLLTLFGVIYMMYRSGNNKTKRIETIQAAKEGEVKELNKILLEVRESDKAMLIELKNTIERFIDTERNHSEVARAGAEILRRNNELLLQVLAKVEYPHRGF